MNQRKLVREANHSVALLLGFVGLDTKCNRILLKWPDVIEDVLAGEEEAFKKDISWLICEPLRVLSESLIQMADPKGSNTEVREAMVNCVEDPIGVKTALIGLCNLQINKLRSGGLKIEFLKGLPND